MVTASRPTSGSYAYSGGGTSEGSAPSPRPAARAALAWIRAAASRASPSPPGVRVTPKCTGGGSVVPPADQRSNSASPLSNRYLAQRPCSGAGCSDGVAAMASSAPWARPNFVALVPAAEAGAGVPVQVAGVRPVAAQHALDPREQRGPLARRQRLHAGAQRRLVELQGAAHRRRVLRVVEVGAGAGAVARHVVEPVARAGERDAVRRDHARQRVGEAAELEPGLVVQQPRVAARGDRPARRSRAAS